MASLTLVTMMLQLGAGQRSSARAPVPPDERRVLWMHASFPYAYGSSAREVALLRSTNKEEAHWSPTTKDFEAIARFEVAEHNRKHKGMASAVLLTNLRSFVAAFAGMPDGKVGRVNIITHANPTRIALSGSVNGTNGDTRLGRPAVFDPNLDPGPARQHYLDNSYAVERETFWNGTLSKGWFNDPEQGRPERNRIRRALAPGAHFRVYACDTADGSTMNAILMGNMANTFDVSVFGFTSSVFYHPGVAGNLITERRRTGVGKDEADAIAHEGIGVMHNDARSAFVREFRAAHPAP